MFYSTIYGGDSKEGLEMTSNNSFVEFLQKKMGIKTDPIAECVKPMFEEQEGGSLFNYFMQKRNSPNGFVPVGGFVAGGQVTEAIEEEATFSKTPILFNAEDILYLWQFPASVHKQALAMRYSEMLLGAKQRQNKGEEVSGVHDVVVAGRKGSILRFRGVRTEIGKLIERLEKKRDLKTLREMDPEQKHTYDGGLHEFDFSKIFRDEETGQLAARGFIGLGESTAGSVLNEWRDGVSAGWLGKPKDDAKYRPINYGGGKPKTGITLDWNGNPLQHNTGIMMPVWSADQIRRTAFNRADGKPLIPSNRIDENGVIYEYETIRPPKGMNEQDAEKWRQKMIGDFYEGKIKDIPGDFETTTTESTPIPMYRPGSLVTASAFRKYTEITKNLQSLWQNGNWADADKAKDLVKHALNYLPDSGQPEAAQRLKEIDYVISRFNSKFNAQDPKTQIKASGSSVKLIGGNQNLKASKEQIPGTRENQTLIQKHFIYNAIDDQGRWVTVDALGRSQTRSAIGEGINVAIYAMQGKYNFHVLNMFLDDIKQEAALVVLKLTGDPQFVEFCDAFKAKSPNVSDLYDKLWSRIKKRARTFVAEIEQFDWGAGTRRKRRTGNVSTDQPMGDDDTSDPYSRLGSNTDKMSDLDRSTGPAGYTAARRDVLSFDAEKNRGRGERTGIRRTGGISPTNVAGNMFQSGHSPDAIAAEISRRSAERKRNATINVNSRDEKQSQTSLKQDMVAASELFSGYVQEFKKSEPDEQSALQKADKKTRETLSKAKVKLSSGVQLNLFDNPPESPKVKPEPEPVVANNEPKFVKPRLINKEPKVEDLVNINPKDIHAHVSSPIFMNMLMNNPQELEKARKLAVQMRSNALMAVVSHVDAEKNKKANYSSDDEADADDITNYRSARGR